MRIADEVPVDSRMVLNQPRRRRGRAFGRQTSASPPGGDHGTAEGIKFPIETGLSFNGEPFPSGAVLRLIDDCIVPALVDCFLQNRADLSGRAHTAHNVDRL
jgi:hypothetical protein